MTSPANGNHKQPLRKFKVTVVDKIVRHTHKVFEARDANHARELAEGDYWDSEHGWTDEPNNEAIVDTYIENIEEEEQ